MNISKVIKILKKNGLVEKRRGHGSAIIYYRPENPQQMLSIHFHKAKEMQPGVVKSLLKQVGIFVNV